MQTQLYQDNCQTSTLAAKVYEGQFMPECLCKPSSTRIIAKPTPWQPRSMRDSLCQCLSVVHSPARITAKPAPWQTRSMRVRQFIPECICTEQSLARIPVLNSQTRTFAVKVYEGQFLPDCLCRHSPTRITAKPAPW